MQAEKLSSLGFRTHVALLELAGAAVEDGGDHLIVRSPQNPHHWWGNFLLVDHVPPPQVCGAWLDRFHAAFPGAEHVALGFDAPSGRRADLAWFAVNGFVICADAVMTASAADGLVAPDATDPTADLRRISDDEDWEQCVEMRIRTWDRPPYRDYVEYIRGRVASDRRVTERGPGAWFGAFIDGRLVSHLGLVAAGDGTARYQMVETDPAYRRRGLASGLVHLAGTWGRAELGVDQLVIVADPGYHAMEMYGQAGFDVTGVQLTAERAPEEL